MRVGAHPLLMLMVGIAFSVAGGPAHAADPTFFRIGTGGVAGTYYPIGDMIARAISQPRDAAGCREGEGCGVAGLIGVPEVSNGSVANVESISRGTVESGFVQSDIAYWAYTGTGTFDGRSPTKGLRTIANLYPETIHVVARKDAGISNIRDLRGKRVSLDEAGSGTLVDASLVLSAHGLTDDRMRLQYLKPDLAVTKMLNGRLDAYFIVAGYPTKSVLRLAEGVGAALVPIDGSEADALLAQHPFFSRDVVPAGTYPSVGETKTLSVGAQWLVGAGVDDDLVYEITKALWSGRARRIFGDGHPKGKAIRLETALEGISVPLHSGAERFYKEIGLVK
jgi:uncharacterized protein